MLLASATCRITNTTLTFAHPACPLFTQRRGMGWEVRKKEAHRYAVLSAP